MRNLYKNDMNNLRKRMLLIGAVLMILCYSAAATSAFCASVQPSIADAEQREAPQLKYYKLEISNCKDCADWINEISAHPTTLRNEEFEQMKKVIQKSITRYNLKTQGSVNFQITGHYGVQYLPYIDKKGRKQIWINGFCTGDESYQKPETDIIDAFDGGSCFFNAIIRSGAKKLVPISIHGFA